MTKNNASEPHADQTEEDGFAAARTAILEKALELAVFEGWTRYMAKKAALEAGESDAVWAAAFPHGVSDLLRYWSLQTDQAMMATMDTEDFKAMKIREKVTEAVWTRIGLLRPHKEATRRAAAVLALPSFSKLGAELSWKTADAVWRGLNDKSTDFNFYSKRGILTGVWTTTLARWFADNSEDEAATRQFLDARISNVMQIEKVKAKMRDANIDLTAPLKFLAGLRYAKKG